MNIDLELPNWEYIGSLIEEYKIDVRWILFQEKFKQDPNHDPWLAGMQTTTGNVTTYHVAYAKDPRTAVINCVNKAQVGIKNV